MLFDDHYVAEGYICIQSILERNATSRVFVLCLGDTVAPALSQLDRVIPITKAALEALFPDIAATRPPRPWAPYVQSLKPFLAEYILINHDVTALTYVDSDMYFWGDPAEIDTEFAGHSFMVTPRKEGSTRAFDGSCFSCRNDDKGKAILHWWQARCIEWCLYEEGGPNGALADDGYLNIFKTEPDKFEGVHICAHPGINASYGNIHTYTVVQTENGIMVNDRPLVCYHYRAFKKTSEELQELALPENIIEFIYRPYHVRLPIAPAALPQE